LNVPTLVRFVRQSGHHGDCGVSTLAMLAGVMYEDALAAAVRYQPAALNIGLSWDAMRSAARRLGVKTRIARSYDITEATGILNVANRKKEEHWVFLWAGRIVEGNGELWKDPDDYLRHYRYRAKWLLVAEEEPDAGV
jgi:ABC-type bacteriocin/lantibiotic exporter with double-glycine peptidase domain